MKTFVKTWRHSVAIEASSPEEAQEIFENLNLGYLDATGYGHEYIEDVSFIDENLNDVEL